MSGSAGVEAPAMKGRSMGREVLGIVAAWLSTLLGGWVAVSSFVLSSQPLAGEVIGVTRSNIIAGAVVLVLAATLGGLQIAGLLETHRRRREPQPFAALDRDAGGPSPEPASWPPRHGWSSPMDQPRAGEPPQSSGASSQPARTEEGPDAAASEQAPSANGPTNGGPTQGGPSLQVREQMRTDQPRPDWSGR